MDELENFFITSYKKIVIQLNDTWIRTVESWNAFDFTLLAKVTFVMLLGYFLANTLSKYIPKGIKALGEKVNLPIDEEFISAIRSFIFKLILFSFVLISIDILSFPISIDFIAKAIVKSILVLSFVGFLLKIVKLILYKMANSSAEHDRETVHVVQPSTLPLFENTALILFTLAGIYQVFSIWNVDMTALLAGAGIGAMAVGMAAKDTLSDIIAGILILTDAPYRVGDVVYVRNNLKGRVSAIGLRNTRIITKSNIEVIVPNTIMGTSQIVNESSSKKEGIRIEMHLSVSNGENVNAVKNLLIEASKASRKIAQDKEIKSMMTGFQMDMLQFKVQCWINNPEDKGSAKGELMENIYFKFRDANIDITMTRYQHVKLSYEEPQELHITQFPKTQQEQFIKEFPDTKQEHFVKEFPDTKQEHFVKAFPDTKQAHFVKEFPDTKQEHFVKEFPDTTQAHFVKEFPDTKQAHFVKEFPDTKQAHFVKEFPDTKQEHFVKEFPDTTQAHFVKEFPDTKQEQVQFVKEFPDTKQEHFVKEFPDTKQEQVQFVKELPKTLQHMYIKEIPNIFGVGMPKVLTKVTKTPSPKDILKNDILKKDILKKDNHEK